MELERFDQWLQPNGPVAVTVRERLEPVMGKDGVFFPPTFAPEEGSDDPPSYVMDTIVEAGGKTVLVDSVGSQANRMEPMFKKAPYSELVPKASVRIGEREVDILDLGHRAADAVLRFSDQWKVLKDAFLDIREKSNAAALAKLAPTSLLFGVWDSRDTQVKLPRIVGSTIRAYQVEKLTRSAQFFAAAEKEEVEGLAPQKVLSGIGLSDAPAGRSGGGVIARGDIQRDAVLNLVALRALSGATENETRALQRYILGLGLVALFSQAERFLREGCLLVPADEQPADAKVVERSGARKPLSVTEADALEYAILAAAAFGVGGGWAATFDKESVKASGDKKKEDKAKGK